MRTAVIRIVLGLTLATALAYWLPTYDNLSGFAMLPPLVAILVAVASGQLLPGLTLAILSAAVVSLPAGTPLWEVPVLAAERAVVDFLWMPLRDSFQLYILGFSAGLVGMVRLIALSGGTQAVADLLATRASGARSTTVASFLMGLAIFFDDYANTLVVGTTMRPIADRFRVSREKLAYIVDSTAAPIAGVAVISTWIGFEVGLFDDMMREVQSGISGYELFFRALSLRFYCWLTLFFVALVAILERDFGPMRRAEESAWSGGVSQDLETTGDVEQQLSPSDVRCHWLVAFAPVALVIGGVMVGMNLDSWDSSQVQEARRDGFLFSRTYWTAVFSNAHSSRVMFLAAMAGSVLAMAVALTRRSTVNGDRVFGVWSVFKTWIMGIAGFYYAIVILILAWAIKEACKAVTTSDYLVAALSGFLEPTFLPILVFLLAAIIAFSIGTSWTTMALLLPTMIPLAFQMGGLDLTVAVAAAVLDGAIFGDHCSPISDTTVLSSIATSCDHIQHVKTQLPYAAVTMAAAAICGYLGRIVLGSSALCLLSGGIVLTAVLLIVGRRSRVSSDT
jgi:Na+/H+ antiporter NhaC